MKSSKTIYQLIDFRVVIYIMNHYYNQMKEISKPTAENWVILMWKLLFNRGYTGLPYRESKIIIVDDSQENYWKSRYLEERNFLTYKDGRKSKTPEWFEVEALAKEGIRKKRIPYLQYPEYEADDIAGAFVKIVREYHKKKGEENDYLIVLNTVDTDWMGLIEKDVWWANLKHYEPRLRTLRNYKEWKGINKFKTEINHPKDIWLEKAENGDKADNLLPGSPIEVIDLLNPPSKYDLTKNKGFKLSVESIIKNGRNTDEEELKKDVKMIIEKGFIVPFTEWNKYPVLEPEDVFISRDYVA